MTDRHMPAEWELDELLSEQPRFDLEAVKRRTLARMEETNEQPVRRRAPLRSFLLAAVICALSVSAVAAADYATNGQLTRALGIRRPQTEAVSEPEPTPEETPVEEPEPVQLQEPP